jgi:adsorption protein B
MSQNLNHYLASGLTWSMVFLAALYLVAGIDDLFIDLFAFLKRIRPKFLTSADLERLAISKQKAIAIIVPAWDEGAIIQRMLQGNRSRIEYENYHFFVGCYPNDQETVCAVKELEQKCGNIHAVENFKDGPTCKGQILNWVIDSILDWERKNNFSFDAFLMQDSEDLIHKKSLQLINSALDTTDFVQIPVFSLALRPFEFVAGVYVDEFAEAHTKDVLVRDRLNGGVPSAGVGTAMSRSFVLSRRLENDGALFRDGCLTEDYELGILSGINGARQAFEAACYLDLSTGKTDYIATREYFPKAFRRSVRQKTRWTIGISLQGWRFIGWRGKWIQKYFLYRDRRGLLTNPALVAGYFWGIIFGLALMTSAISLSDVIVSERLKAVGLVTFAFAGNRLCQRIVCVSRVYGWRTALMVPLRLPIGNIINAMAVINAVYKDTVSLITRRSVGWSKTQHELPADFGGGIVTGVAEVPQTISMSRGP